MFSNNLPMLTYISVEQVYGISFQFIFKIGQEIETMQFVLQ